MYKKNTKDHAMPIRHTAKIWLMIRLTTLILITTFMQVSASSFAQKITLSKSNASLKGVMKELGSQSGYIFLFTENQLKMARPVSLKVDAMEFREVLDKVFDGQPLTYTINEKTITLREKEKSLLQKIIDYFVDIDVKGRLVDENRQPLVGASVKIKGTNRMVITNEKGEFSFNGVDETAVLVISYVGYENKEVGVKKDMGDLQLVLSTGKLEEVSVTVSTGYQNLPKERATGSFSTVDNNMLNKQVTVNIMDRLSTAASGIVVDNGRQGSPQMMVRGLSTIRGPKDPLIVVDNFPYEGNIGNINPNMVESITVLKDAAASSIWGARAANGVIIITTKKAQFEDPLNIDFNLSYTLGKKPDLNYLSVISSSDYIDVERELFNKGFYNTDINSTQRPVLSPVVDLLNKANKGQITNEYAAQQINQLRQEDVRDQYREYMYVPLANRQYALNMASGGKNLSWSSSLGYDDNSGNLDEKYQRLNLRFQNVWQPLKQLKITSAVWLIQTNTQSGRSAYGSITVKNNGLPYMQFADAEGNALIVPKGYNQDYKTSLGNGKLLDWNYYPLTDWEHNMSTAKNTEFVLSTGLNYKLAKGLEAELKYQWQKRDGISETLRDEQSYHTRNYINLYTVLNSDGTVKNNIPKGGILGRTNSGASAQNLRGQLNWNHTWSDHSIAAIAGAEIRDIKTDNISDTFYGYNPDQLTFTNVDYNQRYPRLIGGTASFDGATTLNRTTNRFVSLYANAAYTFKNRYTISGSARRDASNLFGLRTNDQWNPFWSTGLAWNLSNEDFYTLNWLPYLKLRSSYGFNGNIDPSMVAVTTIGFQPSVSNYTGTPMATFTNYYNPNLRWETVSVRNVALDFATRNNLISGSIEYFQKKGENLFGVNPMDYTTGISSLVWNVASMKGKGLDVELRTINLNKSFKWHTIFNFSYYKDEVTRYYLSSTYGRNFVISSVPISGLEGKPVYSIFGYKWGGLDPQTGDPIGYLDGLASKDYARITGTGTDAKELDYFGSALPTKYGNLTNSFSYKNFGIDIGISYKLGYWFRKPSINYTRLFSEWLGHSDYALRWQKPGDETFTNVPSNLYATNSNRDNFYAGSSVLIEKGDHIRLQYINLNYTLDREQWTSMPLTSVQVYTSVQNLGILWQASKSDIDPDYNMGNFTLRPPMQFIFGLRAKF